LRQYNLHKISSPAPPPPATTLNSRNVIELFFKSYFNKETLLEGRVPKNHALAQG
jgi:hypothetical protein